MMRVDRAMKTSLAFKLCIEWGLPFRGGFEEDEGSVS